MRKEMKPDCRLIWYLREVLGGMLLAALLLPGCHSPQIPLRPADAQIWLPDLADNGSEKLLQHWAVNGPVEMQALIIEVDSFLQWSALHSAPSVHVGWYSVSPEQWGALIYAPLTPPAEKAGPGVTISTHEVYRGHPVLAIDRPGYATVFQTEWRGWSMWAWQPSLLQDALLAQKRNGQPLPTYPYWQQSGPLYGEDVACEQIAASSGKYSLRLATDWRMGLAPVSELSYFPDFLDEGYFLSDTETPFATQDIWVGARQKGEEHFLWLPDSSGQMAPWWETQFSAKGEMQAYVHQGIAVRRLLDDRWEHVGRRAALRNPFVARLPEGWLLGNSSIGINRWIDYMLAGRVHPAKWPDELTSVQCSGWAAGYTPWLQHLAARSGTNVDNQWVYLNWDRDTLQLYPTERASNAPDLHWQYDDISGRVRKLYRAGGYVLVEDEEGLHGLRTSGRRVWRIPLDQPLQSGVIRIQEAERTIWAFHTASQIVALDDTGELLPGFPYLVPGGAITDWVAMRGSDGYARFFWQQPGGRIYGITSGLTPCVGWPLETGAGKLAGHWQTIDTDVFFVLSARQWSGYDLRGRLLWQVSAHGKVTAAESAHGQLMIQLDSGELGALTPQGKYQKVAGEVRSFNIREQWLFLGRAGDVAAGYAPTAGDGFQPRYRLPQKVDALLAAASSFQVFFGGSQQGQWHIYTPEGTEIDASPLPSLTRPMLLISDTYLLIVTNQGDRAVAYRWELPG